MKAGGMLMGMMLWVAAGSARAEEPKGGLTGLDAALSRTGRIGALSPRSDGPIGAARIPDERSLGNAPKAAPAAVHQDQHQPLPRSADLSEQEYLQTEGAVANCRIEVARRRRVALAQVSAGTVLLRFTIEPSGRVRDAEAVSADHTDLAVAACAKRVLSEWTFGKHASGNVHVEQAYRLAKVRAMNHAGTSLAAVSQ
jgi:hypothetical protein